MFIKATAKDIPYLADEYKKFIWILFNKDHSERLQIHPSWQKKGKTHEISELYPDIVFVESIVDDELDYLEELGFDRKRMIWSKNHYRSFMITIKDNEVVEHSIGRCFCLDTVIEMLVPIYPELFEPPSIG